MTTSKQRRWQLRQTANGCCQQCGSPTEHLKCDACADKARVHSRNLYRRTHGIPLNAPPIKSGRPRTRV